MSIEVVTETYRKPRRVWECAVCHCEGNWGRGWTWYGSDHDIEEGETLLIACSKECAIKSQQIGMIKKLKPKNRRPGVHKS